MLLLWHARHTLSVGSVAVLSLRTVLGVHQQLVLHLRLINFSLLRVLVGLIGTSCVKLLRGAGVEFTSKAFELACKTLQAVTEEFVHQATLITRAGVVLWLFHDLLLRRQESWV